jgi:FAD/FMN-containing dehydrogenase
MMTQNSKAREELKDSVKGSVLVPDDPDYEDARQNWNAMIDRRPAVIVQCAQADDVPPVVRFARKNGLELSIRGAGHNIAGNALCDNGVTIDFSRMKNVRVDSSKRRAFGDAHGEHMGAQPYVAWQKAFDPLLTPGARNYWKSHNFTELADGALNSIIEFAGKLPSPQCEIFIGLIAGAPNRIAPAAMAYGHRDAKFVLNVHGRWDEAKDDQKCIAWARDFFRASAPYASAGAYVNFMTAEEGDRVAAAYGSNYDRLVEIKRRYDPENVFHLNQNIKP